MSGFSDTYIHLGNGNNSIRVSGIGGEGLYVNLRQGNNTFSDDGAANGGVAYVDAGVGINSITLSRRPVLPAGVGTAGGLQRARSTPTTLQVIDFSLIATARNDFFNSGDLDDRVSAPDRERDHRLAPDHRADGHPEYLGEFPDRRQPAHVYRQFQCGRDRVQAPAGMQVTNGTVASVTRIDPQTYTIDVTPTGQGAVTATVLAGAAIDVNGNANTASNPVSVTFNSIGPPVPVTGLTSVSATPTLTGTVDDPNAHGERDSQRPDLGGDQSAGPAPGPFR